MHMLCACMCTSISRQNTCMAVCGGGSVVTDSIWILTATYVNVVSMYMGLVIELVHGMFMHSAMQPLSSTAYSEEATMYNILSPMVAVHVRCKNMYTC